MRILLVDDDPGVQTTVARMLQNLGYEVSVCSDARQALDALEHDDVRAVLLDIILPYRSGIELAIEIRWRFPDVTVLAMSGGGRTNNRELLSVATEAGAHGAIAKPFRLEALGRFLCDHGIDAAPTRAEGMS